MRQNLRQIQAEGLREAINDFLRHIVSAASDEAKAANFRKGPNNFNNLSENEQACFHSKMLNMSGGFDQVYNLYRAKRLSRFHFEPVQRTYLPVLKTQGGQERYNTFKSRALQHTVKPIDQAIADPVLDIKPPYELLPWFKEPTDGDTH